jgi:hypothetical protein
MRLFLPFARCGFRVTCAAAAWMLSAQDAESQVRWEVVPNASIAWWQVDPHLNHLWASTCPQDVSWRPGAERTGGEQIDYGLPLPKAGFANTVDTVPMPAYPRLGQAEPVCNEAVTGSLTVGDSAHWGAVRGVLRVLGEDLETGNARRNAFASRAVRETHRY